ncbi:endoplasmic reticulum oxidoreductin, putative [Plasmodium berghei]|uniref:Endoplasmic reticulum oxidoreductin, putative n=1 Tax=Plasmodium berghei TaxID=5821 RepID=A0A1D3SFE8_PLABE|nr:endoplasmic reticulum oxidoreductin, putative [Plasmodium berghei]
MKIYLISYVVPILVYLLYILLNNQKGLSKYNNYINSKLNDVLLFFNIYEIKFPNSYNNNEQILGLHIRDIEEDSRVAYEILKELTQKNYFRIFKVNLHVPCKLQKISEKCNEKTKCSVCECTEDEIPYNFRTNEVEIIHDQYAQEDLKKTFIASKLYKDILGTYVPSDEGFLSYVDLIYNSPSYTAYEGKSIWNRIYLENCFQNGENACKEMNNFYKIISGMQSSIAALASEYYYLKNDFVFGDMHTDNTIKNHYIKKIDYDYNLSFFKEKIALYPDRIENLYFTFAILLRALCRLKPLFSQCKCNSEDEIPYNFRTNEVEIIHDQYAQEDLKKTFIASKLYKDILGTYVPSDEGFLSYVDLIYNSPSYTAYEGKSIWNRIYLENCFQNGENACKEMNNFYKIISGMQSSIAALASEYYYLKNDFVFGDMHTDNTIKNHYIKKIDYDYNLSFFKEKIALYPDRIENLYFTFAILLRALCRLKPLFSQCKCNSGIKENDKDAFKLLNEFLGKQYHSCSSEEFLEPIFPTHGKEILSKFMNITSILDCVPCIKCKLHGKLKTTALQIALVEGVGDEHIGSLERNEATALINAIYHFADSILIIKKFEERLKLKKTLFIFYLVSLILFILLLLLSIIFINMRTLRKKKKKCKL